MAATFLTHSTLMQALASATAPIQLDVVSKFLDLWKCKCNASLQIDRLQPGVATFSADFRAFHLNLTDNIACLLLWGAVPDSRGFVERFCRDAQAVGRAQFILSLSQAAHENTTSLRGRSGLVLLGPEDNSALLRSYSSVQVLKGYILKQFRPLSRLIPYDPGTPAKANMFFGRDEELRQLHNERHTSFAIAGSSRIGKTSLVRHYFRQLRLSNGDNSPSAFFVDFYNCNDKSPNGIARHILASVQRLPPRAATPSDLKLAISKRTANAPMRLDLLLDEVDLVLHSPVFTMLGELANDGLCRLILSGRDVLLDSTLEGRSPIGHPLKLIHLGPLGHSAVKDLLLKPFADLGIAVEDPGFAVRRLASYTEGRPNILHSLASRLAEVALARQTVLLEPADIEAVERQSSFSKVVDAKPIASKGRCTLSCVQSEPLLERGGS